MVARMYLYEQNQQIRHLLTCFVPCISWHFERAESPVLCLDLTRRVVVERTQGSRPDKEASVTITVRMARLIGQICGEGGQGSPDEADAPRTL